MAGQVTGLVVMVSLLFLDVGPDVSYHGYVSISPEATQSMVHIDAQNGGWEKLW